MFGRRRANALARTLRAGIPSGCRAGRSGFRATMRVGLGLRGVSRVAFAFGDSVAVLDPARFAEGGGGACAWTGGRSASAASSRSPG